MTMTPSAEGDARAEWMQAVATYSSRLETKPCDAPTLCNRSYVLLRLERFEEALRDGEACVEANARFAKGHVRCAQALEKLGRVEEALKAACRALELDEADEAALRVVEKLDGQLKAGLAVLEVLGEDAKERRCAVRAMLDQRGTFSEKWERVDSEFKRKLVVRMVHRGMEEIKGAFVEAFEPLEAVLNPGTGTDLGVLQQEILAAAMVVSCDLVEAAAEPDSKNESSMLGLIEHAAHGRECAPEVCGPIEPLINAYRFPPFKRHPQYADLSRKLLEMQRSTLVLVVAHLLLGGDGLPTLRTVKSENYDDEFFEQDTDAQSSDLSSTNRHHNDPATDDPVLDSAQPKRPSFSSDDGWRLVDNHDDPKVVRKDQWASSYSTSTGGSSSARAAVRKKMPFR